MSFIKPGVFELYTGPMNSRKTAYLLDRVDQLKYLRDKNLKNQIANAYDFLFLKPSTDTRDAEVKSRSRDFTFPSKKIRPDKPYDIFKILEDEKKDLTYGLILIDEIQFFGKGIDDVIIRLQREKRNIVAAGLDLDFRGEPFGYMGKLALLANEVHKLTAICDFDNCQEPATRTQRLVNNEPANDSEPIVSIQGGNKLETYEARCLEHHIVPKEH